MVLILYRQQVHALARAIAIHYDYHSTCMKSETINAAWSCDEIRIYANWTTSATLCFMKLVLDDRD